jgi:hypothetical protein
MYFEKTGLKINLDRSYSFNSSIQFTSKKFLQNFALALYPLLTVIFLLLLSFNTFKFFKKASEGVKFTASLSKFIFNVGFSLIIWQLCKFLLCFTYSKWYGSIIVKPTLENIPTNPTNITFIPLIDYDINLIWLGLIFIALSYLFKYGSNLEQDQELTI